MRVLPLVLALLLIAPLVPAQSMGITSDHQVRIAYGDIPTTDVVETEGRWNVEHRVAIPEGENRTIVLPAGHELGVVHVNDGADFDLVIQGQELLISCLSADDASPDATCIVFVPHYGLGAVDAFGMTMPVLPGAQVVVFAMDGLDVTSGTDEVIDGGLPTTTDPSLLIHSFEPADGRFWMTVSPESTELVLEPTPAIITWQGLVIGLIVGAVVWYLLVRQGMVQKRQRRQVAGTAAHKEASKEGKATLEWRRRALLAAMKELELARADQTIDLEAYDVLKADFKKQTVTVMRALEELGE